MERRIIFSLVIVLMLTMMACSNAANLPPEMAQPIGWPTTWIELSTDDYDGGGESDHRDVADNNTDGYALYYAADSQYLYLRMETVSSPGWPSTQPQGDARYKWWFDTNGMDAYVHGTLVENAEFLLILEDLTNNGNAPNTTRDRLGELTLMDDLNNDGFTTRWDQAKRPNYTINNAQTAPTGNSSWWRRVLGNGTPGVGGLQVVMGADIGYRIDTTATGGNFVDMYVSWTALGNPSSLCLIWATDNQDNNLDQAPNLDRPEETSCLPVCITPHADFHASETSPCVNDSITFTDDSTGNATSWNWTFGDGETSTDQNPSHQYVNAGSYSVTLIVSNACGSDNETKAVIVHAFLTWYHDADGDGYGDPNDSTLSCTQPGGYVANDDDNCPNDPLKVAPGQCGCGNPDTDTDGDGTADCLDNCPADPAKTEPGICGCGVADTDSDGDGVADCNDLCPIDPNKIDPGVCGCGVADTDTDSDGTADCLDNCPADPNKTAPGQCGCGVADTDTDGDGTADCLDCAPTDPAIHPGATEVCNGIDDDCDGSIDEGVTTTISGTIRANGAPLAGVLVTGIIHSPWTDTDTSDGDGKYTLTGVPCGACNITITATLAGYTFSPQTRTVTGPMMFSVGDQDFNAKSEASAPYILPECMCRGLMISSTEGGSVTTPGEGEFSYVVDTVVDLVASPDPGYKFVNWSGDVSSIADIHDASTNVTICEWYSITANFEPEGSGYSLTISSTEGGSVVAPGEGTSIHAASTVVELVAQPSEGYQFMKWTGAVSAIADLYAASTTITMNADYSITANFQAISPIKYNLTLSGTTGGSVTSPGEGTFTYDEGTVVTLVSTPDPGYRFNSWLGDVDTIANVNAVSTTITMDANYFITGAFKFRAVGGCFIATAAYGTPTAEQIDMLREFRDVVLLESDAGSQFVALYYQLSPPVADFISGSIFLRTLVRELLVDPIVWVVEATGDIWRN